MTLIPIRDRSSIPYGGWWVAFLSDAAGVRHGAWLMNHKFQSAGNVIDNVIQCGGRIVLGGLHIAAGALEKCTLHRIVNGKMCPLRK